MIKNRQADQRHGGSCRRGEKAAGAEVKTATDVVANAEQASLLESVVAAIFRQPADKRQLYGDAKAGQVVFKITADQDAVGRLPPDARVKSDGLLQSSKPRPARACSISMSTPCARTLGVSDPSGRPPIRQGRLMAR